MTCSKHIWQRKQGCSYARRRRPPLTISAPAPYFFFFFFFAFFCVCFFFFFFFCCVCACVCVCVRVRVCVPGTMFHNRASIIAQYICYIHWKWPCQALNPCRGIARGPPVVGAALRWLHSLRLPILFTIIFHHSDWAGYNPERKYKL